MAGGPIFPAFEDLPEIIPIFPLAGVLLLPGGTLPLNIFEPRYLAMTEDALKTDHRMIGMIQPTGADDSEAALAPGRQGPEVYPMGCLGRMVSFAESGDGRYLINLLGIARFRILEEFPLEHGYRRVRPDFSAFGDDLALEMPAELTNDSPHILVLERLIKFSVPGDVGDPEARTPHVAAVERHRDFDGLGPCGHDSGNQYQPQQD